MQSLGQALFNPSTRRALGELIGKPVGGWPETDRARRAIVASLPIRSERNYSLPDLLSYYLTLDENDRYTWKTRP